MVKIAAQSDNIDNAVELTTQVVNQFEIIRRFEEKISKVVEILTNSEKHVKVGDTNVFFFTNNMHSN